MNTFVLVLVAAAAASTIDTILLPTTRPTQTDEWQCATENLNQYFDVPKPTGALFTALDSYVLQLFKTCTSTEVNRLACPFPDKSKWCDFTSVAKPTVLPAYTSFGSLASSWWSAHSAAASSLAQRCPYGWYNAMMDTAAGATFLNETIILAQCHADGLQATGNLATTTTTGILTSGSTAASRSGINVGVPQATQTTGANAQATQTSKTNNANTRVGRAAGFWSWKGLGPGLAATALGDLW
jgi:hypothetical protein